MSTKLFASFRRLLGHPIDFPDLKEPFAIFFPRADYYLSWVARATGCTILELLERNFKGELLSYMKWCDSHGFLGRFGATIDPASFTLRFPTSRLDLIWIPKNSCTSVKDLLLSLEPPAVTVSVSRNRFHETTQALFGPRRSELVATENQPTICVIRHPIERVVSCYLDKFAKPVITGRPFEGFIEGHVRKAQRSAGRSENPRASISFAEFIHYITPSPAWAMDAHWRPQACFLGGRAGDIKFFPIHRLGDIWRYLGLERENNRLNSSFGGRLGDLSSDGDLAELSPVDLAAKDLSQYDRLVTPQLLRTLTDFYREDFALYDRAIGTRAE